LDLGTLTADATSHVMWNEEGVNLFWDVELIEYEDGILDLDAIA